MKLQQIVEQYYLDENAFRDYILQSGLPYEGSASNPSIPDNYVNDCVESFWVYNEEKEQERQNQLREEAAKRQAMAQMLITSGFRFDGYRIVKYSGYISGDDAISVDRGMAVFGLGTNVKDKLMASLSTIRRNALRELKEAAYNLGCNAVIGVDFDYLTLDPQTANLSGGTTYQPYVFGVTANGNAVVIEKIEE